MKRIRISLVIASVIALPARAVEVTGSIAVGLDFSHVGAPASVGGHSMTTHGLNDGYSLINVSHSRELGNDMKMDLLLQAGWKPSNGSGNRSDDFANRNSYLGLSGGFGAIRLGSNDNAYSRMITSHNYMDEDWSYGNIAIMGRTGAGGLDSVWDRTSDTVMYYSPNIGGLGFEIDYATPSNGKTVTLRPSIISTAAEFVSPEGRFRLYCALQNASDQGGAENRENDILFGGGMNFENVKIDLMFETMRSKVTGSSEVRRNSIDLELGVELPTGLLGLSVVKALNTKGLPGGEADTGATSISSEYMHKLAEGSWLFLVLSRIRNEGRANYNGGVFFATGAGGTGSDYTNIVVGFKHQFGPWSKQ